MCNSSFRLLCSFSIRLTKYRSLSKKTCNMCTSLVNFQPLKTGELHYYHSDNNAFSSIRSIIVGKGPRGRIVHRAANYNSVVSGGWHGASVLRWRERREGGPSRGAVTTVRPHAVSARTKRTSTARYTVLLAQHTLLHWTEPYYTHTGHTYTHTHTVIERNSVTSSQFVTFTAENREKPTATDAISLFGKLYDPQCSRLSDKSDSATSNFFHTSEKLIYSL